MKLLNIESLLAILNFFLVLVTGWITCPSTGYQRCSGSDAPYFVWVYSPLVLSNCVYEGCPQIFHYFGDLVVNNVTFKSNNKFGSGTMNIGGAIVMYGDPSATLSISNSKFVNVSASNAGGAVAVYGPFSSTVKITNTVFQACQAGNSAGAIYLGNGVSANLTGVTFNSNVALKAGALYIEQNSQLVINGMTCVGNYAYYSGACMQAGSSVVITGTNIVSNWDYCSLDSVFFYGYDTVNATFNNLQIVNGYADKAVAIYMFGPGALNLNNVQIQACAHIDASHSIIYIQDGIIGNFQNVVIDSTIGGSAVFLWGSKLTWRNGGVTNFNGNCLVSVQAGGSITMSSLLFDSNTLVANGGTGNGGWDIGGGGSASDITITNTVVATNGVIFFESGSTFTINRVLINGVSCNSPYGCAIYHSASGNLVLGSGVVIKNVNSFGRGAVFYLDSTGNVTFQNTDISISNYTTPYVNASFAYLASTGSGGVFNGVPLTTSSISPGTLFVVNYLTADIIINSNLLNNFFPSTMSWKASNPSMLRITNFDSINGNTLLLSEQAPVITVKPINYFGEDTYFDPSTHKYVIVQLFEVNRNATLTGETLKAVVDSQSNSVTFDDYDFASKSSGVYRLQVRGAFKSLKPAPSKANDWPTISITFADCNSDSQVFVPDASACWTKVQVSSSVRSAFAAISAVFALVSIASLFGMRAYREFNIIKANSYAFLSVMVIGSIISFLSLVVQATPFASGCMLAVWLDNLGFAINLASIITKMYRLQKIFLNKERKSVSANFSDSVMFRYVIAAVSLVVIYLIIWSAVQPSLLQDLIISSSTQVVVNDCSVGTFSSLAVLAKLFITLMASYFAFAIRNIPSNFNETKLIGFACYNWLVFGTIVSLIVQTSIQDRSSAFIVNAIALLFPHLSSLYLLVFNRLYICQFNPELAKAAVKITLDVDKGSVQNSKTKGKSKMTSKAASTMDKDGHAISTAGGQDSVRYSQAQSTTGGQESTMSSQIH